MLRSLSWAKFLKLGFAVIFFASTLVVPKPSSAQERYPTVARISFVSGPVTYSRGDDPDHWDDAIENVPLTIGDRIYSPEDGRAELQLPAGNFVRLAPRSYFSTLNLTDDIKQFYLGEGTASFNIKRLRSDEVIEVDTPNVSVTLDEPGIYRITVDEDGNSRISARRGRVTVAASGRQIDVENREIRVYGIDSPRYEFVGLPATDPFDRWVTERDHRFERSYSDAYRYASDEIIGVEELTDHGRWEQIPEYGYAWTPANVGAGWAPFSDGRWFWQDPYGWTWISRERWGWATSHYGRWTPYRSRWYWVPVRPRTRYVRYEPACVEFVRVRDHVGWFPLHPRDRHIPWWERRDRRPIQNITYVNRTYVTVVNHNTFISARPVRNHIVRDTVIVREAGSTRVITDSLPIPNRSSLRVVSETGGRRDQRPSDKILARSAVVRTAPPPAQATFQEKLPEIQKRQGRPLEPSTVVALASQKDETSRQRVRIRPAAAETSGGDFAPRTPGASGPAPQPVTPARGKQLATRENPVDTKSLGRGERPEKSPAQQQPAQPSPAEPSKGVAGKPEAQTPEQDRERRRQEKQTPERERQAEQQKQQQLERKQQEQQKDQERQTREQQKEQRDLERRQQDQERKAELQKQQQDQDRREQQAQKEQAREQQKQELERKQQTKQKEEERKAKLQQDQERREQQKQQVQERQGRELQKQQESERRQQQQQLQDRESQQQRQQEQERAQQLRQQQLQERQAREQQRQQELERRQQQQQREQERNAQQQRQQDQIRREQLRQQQAQERQAQQQQRQQEVERRQQSQQREQEREAQLQQRQQEQARRQQLRQQQVQEREAQQQQRQQEQKRVPPRQPQLPGGQPPELQRPPGQP